jgi:hypothetical protein
MKVHVVQHISLFKHHLLCIAKLLVAGNEDAVVWLQAISDGML